MEELAATTVARRFAAALATHDEAAARACAREWRGDRDGPARLFDQLVNQPVSLELAGDARPGTGGRAAQPVAIINQGQAVEQLVLLGDGAPFLITGVATKAPHVEHFLAGNVPAVLAWDELTPDGEARAAAETLVKALEGGQAEASPRSIVVVGYLAAAASRGARVEVVDARGLPRLGRAVVEARIVAEGDDPERVFLYLDRDGWRARTAYFSGDTLTAP